jgi:hypothetical protein
MILKTIRVTLSITIYPAMEGFVEAEAGYRFYAAGQPGEWRALARSLWRERIAREPGIRFAILAGQVTA